RGTTFCRSMTFLQPTKKTQSTATNEQVRKRGLPPLFVLFCSIRIDRRSTRARDQDSTRAARGLCYAATSDPHHLHQARRSCVGSNALIAVRSTHNPVWSRCRHASPSRRSNHT